LAPTPVTVLSLLYTRAPRLIWQSSQRARVLFFDRDIKRVTEIAWDQAVHDTANVWQSIFWNALGPERAWQLYGISAPVGKLGMGRLLIGSSRTA